MRALLSKNFRSLLLSAIELSATRRSNLLLTRGRLPSLRLRNLTLLLL